MSSNAGITIHGLINKTHTSQLNAQYSQNNIPTPWPLVIFSSLLSFIICCCGAIAASRSLDTNFVAAAPTTTIRIPRLKKWTSKRNTSANIPLQSIPPPPYTAQNGNLVVSSPKQAPPPTTTDKYSISFSISSIVYYATASYCIFRAITSFIISLRSLHDNTTPLPAPSTTLLSLLATQILYTSVSHPALPRLLLLLSTYLLSISFGIVSYAPTNHNYWPRYSTLQISTSNCALPAQPLYAGDCLRQAPHWLSVGCGTWTKPPNFDADKILGWNEWFANPYGNTGDLNSKTGMNTLHAVELVVILVGTAWWLVVLWQIGEVFELLGECFNFQGGGGRFADGRQRSVLSALKTLGLSLFRVGSGARVRKPPTESQEGFYRFISGFGLCVAFFVLLMAIGGHTSQMMKKLQTTYLESFGPQVGANFTLSESGLIVGSEYWGNETSWTDCFVMRAPGSRSGFWREWVEGNRESDSLFRIAAGL